MEILHQQPIHPFSPVSKHASGLSSTSCSRCHGLLIETFCISPSEGNADFQIRVMKCLQCGDLFDSTILENRWRSTHHQPIHQKGARGS